MQQRLAPHFYAACQDDATKMNPFVWFAERGEYLALGKTVGKSRSIGNEVKRITC